MPSNEKHPEAEVRALTVNKWVLVPSVDRGRTKRVSCLAAQPLIAQQAAISNKYFHLLGKEIAPLPMWQRLRPCTGRGCLGAPSQTANKPRLRRGWSEQSAPRDPPQPQRCHSASAPVPQASTAVKTPGFVPRRFNRRCVVDNENKAFRWAPDV